MKKWSENFFFNRSQPYFSGFSDYFSDFWVFFWNCEVYFQIFRNILGLYTFFKRFNVWIIFPDFYYCITWMAVLIQRTSYFHFLICWRFLRWAEITSGHFFTNYNDFFIFQILYFIVSDFKCHFIFQIFWGFSILRV